MSSSSGISNSASRFFLKWWTIRTVHPVSRPISVSRSRSGPMSNTLDAFASVPLRRARYAGSTISTSTPSSRMMPSTAARSSCIASLGRANPHSTLTCSSRTPFDLAISRALPCIVNSPDSPL